MAVGDQLAALKYLIALTNCRADNADLHGQVDKLRTELTAMTAAFKNLEAQLEEGAKKKKKKKGEGDKEELKFDRPVLQELDLLKAA